jgi:hypothetical protein
MSKSWLSRLHITELTIIYEMIKLDGKGMVRLVFFSIIDKFQKK